MSQPVTISSPPAPARASTVSSISPGLAKAAGCCACINTNVSHRPWPRAAPAMAGVCLRLRLRLPCCALSPASKACNFAKGVASRLSGCRPPCLMPRECGVLCDACCSAFCLCLVLYRVLSSCAAWFSAARACAEPRAETAVQPAMARLLPAPACASVNVFVSVYLRSAPTRLSVWSDVNQKLGYKPRCGMHRRPFWR